MRTWRLLFAVGMLAALLVPASSASAEPHETVGDPQTTCQVNGTVELQNGVDTNPSDDHYTFVDTNLECSGKLGGLYSVGADGDTTDFEHQGTGEDCEQGGSAKKDKDGDGVAEELHSGTLSATGPQDLTGEVHFVRLGTTVLADGPLWDGTSKGTQTSPDHFFQAELEFIPTEGDCTKQSPITEADLVGTAEIYNEGLHDCTLEVINDKKASDPHCNLTF